MSVDHGNSSSSSSSSSRQGNGSGGCCCGSYVVYSAVPTLLVLLLLVRTTTQHGVCVRLFLVLFILIFLLQRSEGVKWFIKQITVSKLKVINTRSSSSSSTSSPLCCYNGSMFRCSSIILRLIFGFEPFCRLHSSFRATEAAKCRCRVRLMGLL